MRPLEGAVAAEAPLLRLGGAAGWLACMVWYATVAWRLFGLAAKAG